MSPNEWHATLQEHVTDQVVRQPITHHKWHSIVRAQSLRLRLPQLLRVALTHWATVHLTLDTHDQFPRAPHEVRGAIGYSAVIARVRDEATYEEWTRLQQADSQGKEHHLLTSPHLKGHL